MKSSLLYILAAGGTGGHLYPAQAVAKELLGRGHRVALVTDPRFAAYTKGFEGVEIHTLPTRKMSGGVVGKALALLGLLRSLWYARGLLKRLNPAVVIGFGGYPSFPTMQAAIWSRIPTLIHEQNKRMGRANRMLAGGVSAIAASFPDTIGGDARKITVTGNPVRPEILALKPTLADGRGIIHLLVFGGSQGARIFSEAVPEAIEQLPEALRQRLRITQQARQEDGAAVVERYSKLRIIADIRPFFEDMPDQLAKANLVICRAGASTVAEMAAAGKPAIYAPYPFAADKHQDDNAIYMVEHQAGWLMQDAEMTPQRLAALLEELLTSPTALREAGGNAAHLALPNAAKKVAELAEGLAKQL